MVGAAVEAGRRGLAGFVLLVAGWLAVWVASFRVGTLEAPLATGKATRGFDTSGPERCAVGTNYCVGVHPLWAIPVALAIALIGLLAVTVIYRPRRAPVDRRAVDVH